MRKGIGKILKYGTLLSTWGLIAIVLLQIVCRFSWFDTPSWTEEASRFLFIYAIAFASGLALKTNCYVHLDMFYNRFSPKLRRVVDHAIPIITFLIFAIFSFYSVFFIALGVTEKSPSLGLNMGMAFSSMLIMGSTICYYAWPKIIKTFKNRNA